MLAWLAVAVAGLIPSDAVAQDPTSTEADERQWWNAWSVQSDQERVLWFMTTLHINHVDDGLSNDELGGIIYKGLYAATLETTHGDRAFTAGVERSWVSGGEGIFGWMLGYRAGLIYGYDRRLGWVAEAVKILPFLQPVAYGRIGRFTFDLAYTRVVVSLTMGFRL